MRLQAADICGEYKLKSFCENTFGGGSGAVGAARCQWCNYTTASGAECISADDKCAPQPVPSNMAAIGVKAHHTDRQVLALMAASKAAASRSSSDTRVARAPANQQILEGLFVRPCQHYGKTQPSNLDISEFDTRRYNHCNGGQICTYELDRTVRLSALRCVCFFLADHVRRQSHLSRP